MSPAELNGWALVVFIIWFVGHNSGWWGGGDGGNPA